MTRSGKAGVDPLNLPVTVTGVVMPEETFSHVTSITAGLALLMVQVMVAVFF